MLQRLLKNLTGATMRSVKGEIDTLIKRGAFRGSYRNADELIDLINRGVKINKYDLGNLVIILMKEGDDSMRQVLSKELLKNPSFFKALSGKTKKEFVNYLQSRNFTDKSIEAIMDAWTDRGLRFTKEIFGVAMPRQYVRYINNLSTKNVYQAWPSFKRYALNQPPNDPFRKIATNLIKLRIFKPFKGFSKQELFRLLTYIGSGQTIYPTEYLAILRNGKGVLGKVLGVAGAWSGHILRRWVQWSFYMSVANILYEMIKDLGKPGSEYEGMAWYKVAVARVLDDSVFADFRYFIPVLNIDAFFDKIVNPLMQGDGESIVKMTEDGYTEARQNAEDHLSVRGNELLLQRKLTDEQYANVGKDENGQFFYYSPDYPIRYINDDWYVFVPNQGWYDIDDIE